LNKGAFSKSTNQKKKRNVFSCRFSQNIFLTIPFTTINWLCESHQNEKLISMIQSSPFASKIELRGDKMRVDADVIKSFLMLSVNLHVYVRSCSCLSGSNNVITSVS
jgi:hypothetical protein